MENYKKLLVETFGLCKSDVDIFLSNFEVVNYNKGDFLERSGDKCNVIRIIIEGSAIAYTVVDGKEYTTNFFFVHDCALDFVNYYKQGTSNLNVKALEDMKIIEFKKTKEDYLQSKDLVLYRMAIETISIYFIKAETQRQSFISKSVKERYLDLSNNNKQVISNIPQRQIATYIGTSAEHLCRIRKEMLK